MITPAVKLVAWADRVGKFIFVADPSLRGRYVMTHPSVAHVGCTHCGAVPGEPCKRVFRFPDRVKYTAGTHVARRALYQQRQWPRPRGEDVAGVPNDATDPD